MKIPGNKVILFIIPALFIFLLIVLIVSEIYVGAVDSITHYHFARYAIRYPELYLDHWGKPLFTLLSSPFAQFGYKGAAFFNILSGILSALFAYLTARKTGIKNAWIVPILAVFIPVYFVNLFTSLTEVLFSFVLIASIYSFSARRYVLSAIIISFILFVRNEGMMYIALFALAFLLGRKYKALPFLLTGFIVFGLAGLPGFGDFFWFFTEMPYGAHGSELYGSGSFWEYFRHADRIIGIPVAVLLVTGTLALLFRLFRNGQSLLSPGWITLYILIIPAFWGFILAQSILWWQGLFGVLFSYRFMVCVMPLAAIIAAAAFDPVQKTLFRKNHWVHYLVALIVLFLVVRTTLRMHRIPFKTDQGRKTIAEAAGWIKDFEGGYNRIFYFDPTLVFYLEMDPYDRSLSIQNLSDKENPHNNMDPGDLLVYDPHFGGFENRVPSKNIEGNPYFEKLAVFHPDPPFMAPGDVPYKVSIYKRRESPAAIMATVSEGFENAFPGTTNRIAFEGSYSFKLDPSREYSPALEISADSLSASETRLLKASAHFWFQNVEDSKNIFLVVSAHFEDHTTLDYFSRSAENLTRDEGGWSKLTVNYDLFDLPEGTLYVKVYAWYQGSGEVFVDDFVVEY